MPDKVTKQKKYNNTMLFRMESEFPPVQPIRLRTGPSSGWMKRR